MLYMENRVCIKLIALTIQDGLSNAKGGFLESTTNTNGEYRREETHKSSINLLFNITILGNSVCECQRDSPLEDDPKGTVGRITIINFENAKVRKIIEKLEHVIDLSRTDVEVKDVLKRHVRLQARFLHHAQEK